MENLVYIYDGSFEGLLCCVFSAYENKERPAMVTTEHGLQVAFGQQVRRITTEIDKAIRVEKGFTDKAGSVALYNAKTAFCSHELDREYHVFRYFFVGFKHGKKTLNMLTHPDVLPVLTKQFNVIREMEHMNGFVRFSKMKNDVFFSRIRPKNNVLPLMMSHFADRFSVQPFVIYDANHNLAGIYDLKEWQIFETDNVNMPELADGEEDWINLWKDFCSAISIKQRENRRQQMTMCPKRFWDNMPELREQIIPTKNKVGLLEHNQAVYLE